MPIENLPSLIERAAAALAKATTAAEILDASREADVAYSAAKKAAQFAKLKDAHNTILKACHRVMADALVIEARAQCRLADEYDAAQERGEVRKDGQRRPHKEAIPNENTLSSVTDIGLTSKQVHEARAIRDAERKKPGMIRKALDEKLEAGEEPTRAEVKRVISGKPKSKIKRAGKRGQGATPKLDRAREIIREKLDADQPISPHKLQAEHGDISHVTFDMAITAEVARKEAIEEKTALDPSLLSKSAQQKLDAAIRQHKSKLAGEFYAAVNKRVSEFLEETILPRHREEQEQAKRLANARKGIMDKATFKLIWSALHPDSRRSISDKKLAEAFDAFSRMEKLLLDEKNSPTEFQPLPSTVAEWDRMKAAATAARRAKRAASGSANVAVRR